MEIPNLTILTKKQIKGPDRLKVIEKMGNLAELSDTARLRKGDIYNLGKKEFGEYWLKDLNKDGKPQVKTKIETILVNVDSGDVLSSSCNGRKGVRLALPASFILLNSNSTIGADGLERAAFGYYPNSVLSENMQTSLSNLNKNGSLVCLGEGCTFDRRTCRDYDKDFLPEKVNYYGNNGNVYAIVRENGYHIISIDKYENEPGRYFFTSVDPVIWVRHPEDDLFITEQILTIARLNKDHYDGNFEESELKWYLDNYLAQDLVNPIVYNYIGNYNKEKEQEPKQTVTYFMYKDEEGKLIKRVKVKVKIGKRPSKETEN